MNINNSIELLFLEGKGAKEISEKKLTIKAPKVPNIAILFTHLPFKNKIKTPVKKTITNTLTISQNYIYNFTLSCTVWKIIFNGSLTKSKIKLGKIPNNITNATKTNNTKNSIQETS